MRRAAGRVVDARRPDGTAYRSLPEDVGKVLASELGLPLREIQALCLDAGIVPERYARNLNAHSMPQQARLLRSRAVVVGLGGLGGHVLDTLCRMGVGRIAAADGDSFEQSNLNRQLLSSAATLGQPKAQAALERAAQINPAVELHAEQVFWDERAMESILTGADIVVDALGGLDDRPALARAATGAGVPLVTAAIAGHSGYVATVLPGEAGPTALIGTGAAAEDTLGSPAPAVAIAANLQCAEALRILGGDKPVLAGKMLVFDLVDMTFETMQIA